MRSFLCSMLLCLLCGFTSAQDVAAQAADAAAPTTHIQESPQQYYEEGILQFHDNIKIFPDGTIRITEHIKVYATGNQIRKGIFRNIPLFRKDKYGRRKRIAIKVTEVLKDSLPEPYKESEKEGYLVIRIGNANVDLHEGVYQYAITYETRGHIGFFEGYDELYWNVTGSEWQFPIVQASATIELPTGAKIEQSACYTGAAGSKASNCTITYDDEGRPTFSTSQLALGEGFTIAAGFTANIITRPPPPTFWEKILNYFYNYREIFLALLGGGGLFWYFYATWKKYGKDPETPVIVPTFNPPDNLSPAALRYLYKKDADNKGFSAALVNMAIKKVMIIKQDGRRDFELEKTDVAPDKLAKEETAIFAKLLRPRKSISLDAKHHTLFSGAQADFKASLSEQFDIKDFFLKNTRQIVIGGIITGLVLFLYMLMINAGAFFVLLVVTPFLGIGISMITFAIKNFGKGCTWVISLFFGILFSIGPLISMLSFADEVPVIAVIFMLVVTIAFVQYIRLIKAPTATGAALYARIEGFRMYLSTAEEHRLNMLTPPEHTPALFEKLLPYAIALDLENEWSDKFSTVLEQANYNPDWYDGDRLNYTRFSSSFSNGLTASVMSSQIDPTPPASSGSSSSGSSSWSSGSSGGGSSGGGGGGGGGGGW